MILKDSEWVHFTNITRTLYTNLHYSYVTRFLEQLSTLRFTIERFCRITFGENHRTFINTHENNIKDIHDMFYLLLNSGIKDFKFTLRFFLFNISVVQTYNIFNFSFMLMILGNSQTLFKAFILESILLKIKDYFTFVNIIDKLLLLLDLITKKFAKYAITTSNYDEKVTLYVFRVKWYVIDYYITKGYSTFLF